MDTHELILNNIGEKLYSTLQDFAAFKQSKNWRNYKELLPAFTNHLGFNLIVSPDKSKKLGEANGRDVVVKEEWGMSTFYFAYFHELAHNLLHFENGVAIDRSLELMEAEADCFSAFFYTQLFPKHAAQIIELARSNPKIKPLHK